jgi:hypothetical protein
MDQHPFLSEEQCRFGDFCQWRSLGYTVFCSVLQHQMCQLVIQHRFRASTGWLYGFLRRHNVSSRVCTSIISKLRPKRQQVDQKKKRSFYQYVNEVSQKQNTTCAWNMEETPVLLDMVTKRTKGRGIVTYLNTGNERKRISVVLCFSEYGQKMSLLLVLKTFDGWRKIHALRVFRFSNKRIRS